MAAYLKPLDHDETAWLTLGMADTGLRLDLTGLPKPWVDKHSTGGVGDKTTLVVLPMLAAKGLTMIKMSGRGLGITGGTVDKLMSVPGFRMNLSPTELKNQAGAIGIAITGQTFDLAPADKVMYAMRDAIGAVANMPLIVSSILSKKLAGGAEIIVLDVKCGSGGFMPDEKSALELAHLLKETANRCGLKTHISVTDMSQPLGRTTGNAIEVIEAMETLSGVKSRFRDLCVQLAAHTLIVCGKADESNAVLMAERTLDNGEALAKAKEWFRAQGADVQVFDDISRLPRAKWVADVKCPEDGWVEQIDAGAVGRAVVDLGGGRHKKEDGIDPSVGIELNVEVGDPVAAGQRLFTVYSKNKDDADAARDHILQGFRFSSRPVAKPPLILATL